MQGYYKDPAGTAAALDADRWLHTGDLAYRDGDGYFFIVGRSKELRTSPALPADNSSPARLTILVSKPHGKPGDPILFVPGGTGFEKTLPASDDPIA